MAKCIQEIAFDAVEAFWRSVMDDLMGETDFFEQLKADSFDEFAEILIRALAVQRARIDGDTAIDR